MPGKNYPPVRQREGKCPFSLALPAQCRPLFAKAKVEKQPTPDLRPVTIMTPKEAAGPMRLCLWAETPEQRHDIESRLPKFRRELTSSFLQGQELAGMIKAARVDGIIFYSEKISLVRSTLRLLEDQCPACCRFVVCSRQDDAPYRSLGGFPPAILRDEESPETWAGRIQRAVLVNQWLAKPEFRLILPRLRTIPSLPEAHRRVVEALRDPQFELSRVSRLVAQDVALTTQLLKVVNSASLGLTQPIHSIPDAISLVGAIRLQSLVVSAWAYSLADEKMCRGFSPAAEWKHALAVAQAAEKLARERRAKAAIIEFAFIAGLLHDVGKLMLAGNSPEAYAGILALAGKQSQPLWQMETQVLGYSHAEVGACLLGLWGLDLAIVEAVAAHHQPTQAASQEVTPAKLVFDANLQVDAAESVPTIQN
jgi:putative nucleotidyltransferase with HDIG domain